MDPRSHDRDDTGRWTVLNRRLRRAFLEGAEKQSRISSGRPLTVEELRRVLRRYPGDLAER
jgi:hypothetical protein